ncbi:hypothetical protein ASD38_20775 [Caulobacter sp. Root487D2Y]|uniref:hypothetical protein n=1 Tax=Caulobacter sp. Root487D2Y TaxID=1736547 RepID=UPI0006FE2655|nr:hypothetical protein [Caulobacter sp. Root487D2Y]KQY26178.1 hypothetical protein ASD38_20775 [Caulobacter sp. Root487D2Y]
MTRAVGGLAAILVATTASGALARQTSSDPLPDIGVLSDSAPIQSQSASGLPLLKLNGVAQETRTRASPAFGTTRGDDQAAYLLNLDARGLVGEGRPLRLNYSLRASATQDTPSGDGIRLYVRETYLTWTPSDTSALNLGRVNYRSGVAYAYNPTDLFRGRSNVDEVSLDPLVRRESRLGVVMVSALALFDKGAVTAIVAPKLSEPRPFGYVRPQGVGLDLYRTNARARGLLKASYALDHNFAPEVLLLYDDDRWSAGLNLSTGLGDTVVLFLEGRAGVGDSLLARSTDFARETGVLPPGPEGLPGAKRDQTFHGLATGFSYSPTSKINLVLEYDHSSAAPSAAQWSRLSKIAAGGGLAQAEFRLLNYFASNEEELRIRDAVFMRVGADSVFVDRLGGSVLANISPQDGSGLVQATAVLDLSTGWSVSLVGATTFGGDQTVYGGAALARSLSIGFAKTF